MCGTLKGTCSVRENVIYTPKEWHGKGAGSLWIIFNSDSPTLVADINKLHDENQA
jgi:hypothetical protein